MPATSRAGARRRAIGIPSDAKEVRASQRAGLDAHNDEQIRAAVVAKILSRQDSILAHARATLLDAVPAVLANIISMALGNKGSPKVQLDAGTWVIERAGHGVAARDGRPLHELPLDQLETVLATALDNARQLQALPGTSQVIDDTGS